MQRKSKWYNNSSEKQRMKKLEEKKSDIAWSQVERCLHLSALKKTKTKRKTEHKVSDISWNALKFKAQHTYSKINLLKKISYIISKLFQESEKKL